MHLNGTRQTNKLQTPSETRLHQLADIKYSSVHSCPVKCYYQLDESLSNIPSLEAEQFAPLGSAS